MTGREALEIAANMVHETDLSLYTATAKSWLNVILGELYEIANRRREWRGEEPFHSLPQLGGLDEELPYDEELSVRVIPKGCLLYTSADFRPRPYSGQWDTSPDTPSRRRRDDSAGYACRRARFPALRLYR